MARGAKFIFKEVQALNQLTAHCLTAGKNSIRFDPHSTYGNDSALCDELADAFEKFRVVFLQPGDMLGSRKGKDQGRTVLDKTDNVGKSPVDLATRFAQRPQPCRVNVCMANSANSVRSGVSSSLHKRLKNFTCCAGSCEHIVKIKAIERTIESQQDIPFMIAKVRRRLDHLVQNLNIKCQSVDIFVHDNKVCLAEVVQLLVRSSELVAIMSGLERRNTQKQGVCRCLNDVVDVTSSLLCDRKPPASRVQGLDSLPRQIPYQCFSMETYRMFFESQINAKLKTLTLQKFHVVGNLTMELEPRCLPCSAPCLSQLKRSEVGFHGLRKTNWLRDDTIF